MIFEEDYSYIPNNWNDLVSKGYAKLDLYSLRLDRHLTEEQMEHNKKSASLMSREEFSAFCEQRRRFYAEKITKVVDLLNNNFSICQYDDSKNISYSSDWDLFFWCNCTAIDNKYQRNMSYCTLSFNNLSTIEKKFDVLTAVQKLLADYVDDDIQIYIQYSLEYNDDIIQKDADKYYNLVKGKTLEISQYGKGTIRKIADTYYGFFKPRAKTKYYPLSDIEVIEISKLNSITA